MKAWGTTLLLGITLSLGGCGGEAPKPQKVPMPPVAKKAAPPAPAPTPPPAAAEVKAEAPPVVSYSYDPKGKPDPFKPLVVERVEKPPAKKVAEEIPEGATPLERMELGQLKLVAIVWGIRDPRAMVEDGTGKGYILSSGTAIGKNKGKVTRITTTGVVVTERYEDSSGKFKTRDVTLKLYAD